MRLLDSHTLLWWVRDDPALRKRARTLITDSANECYVSHASAWEMAIKASLGKLTLPSTVERFVVAAPGVELVDAEWAYLEPEGVGEWSVPAEG